MKPTMITIGTLISFTTWLIFMAVAATAQNPPVLDTSGEPLRRGTEYYIKPAITDNGGRFTLVERSSTPDSRCPLYVGQESSSDASGLPVTFSPFAEGDNEVNQSTDVQITFAAATTCIQGTTWVLNRGFIVAGTDNGDWQSSYFKIGAGRVESTYEIEWCPFESCASIGCSPPIRCQPVGSVVENGKRLLALDAPNSPIPVVFEKANN